MRPTLDEEMLAMAVVASSRGTCIRRRVGCVLTNARGHILATGRNGVASGMPHCNEVVVDVAEPMRHLVKPEAIYKNACSGAFSPSGTNLEGCEAIHAEQNALLQCKDVWQIHTCYTLSSPCMQCIKLLRSTSCKRVVFMEEYPHPQAKEYWLKGGQDYEWVHHPDVRAFGVFRVIFDKDPRSAPKPLC